MRAIFDRRRKFYSNEILEQLVFIINCLCENVYSAKLKEIYAKTNLRIKCDTVDKKTCLLYLHSKGSEITRIINHKINATLNIAYPSVRLLMLFEMNCSLKQTKFDSSSLPKYL